MTWWMHLEICNLLHVMRLFKNIRDQDGMRISTKAHVIQDESQTSFVFMFHALLIGHEDWVHTVSWQPSVLLNGKKHQPLSLISSSADKSIIIWKPEQHGQTWVNKERFGEIGGSTLGFYGALFSPDGNTIVSNGYHGSIEFWKKLPNEEWVACFGTSGHQSSVEDLSWDPTGQFLISTSLDQTTRLYSEWKGRKFTTWHAMARPQVHGYDLHTLAFTSKYQFVSGADEKVVRVFEAPRSFIDYLGKTSNTMESKEFMVCFLICILYFN